METVKPSDQQEPSIHSFVVRIWLEENDAVTGEEVWRGHITHIPGDERKYLKNLSEIPDFIESYLKFTPTLRT